MIELKRIIQFKGGPLDGEEFYCNKRPEGLNMTNQHTKVIYWYKRGLYNDYIFVETLKEEKRESTKSCLWRGLQGLKNLFNRRSSRS